MSNKLLKPLKEDALSFSILLYEGYKKPVIKKGGNFFINEL